jgi:type II secretory pathway predicted ATPase ExeA
MNAMSQALCDFFGCLRLPFDKSLPVRDLFPSTAHQEIQARLNFALQHRFATLITGDVGSGKSTALRAFIHSLDANLYLTAYISNPNLTVQALFAQILTTFPSAPPSTLAVWASACAPPWPTYRSAAVSRSSSLTRPTSSATACSTSSASGSTPTWMRRRRLP